MKKLAVMAIVTAMVCLSLASVSPSADAGDVGGNVIDVLGSWPVGIDVKDVAWNGEGSMALGVGYDSNGDGMNAAWYYPDNDTWIPVATYPYGAGYTLNAVEWSQQNSLFYMGGNVLGGSISCFYTNQGSSSITSLPTTGSWPSSTIEDVSVDVYGNLLAVGPGGVVNFFLNSNGSWNAVADFEGTGTWDYHDVDYEAKYMRFYVVGEPAGGGYAMVVYTDQIPDASTWPAWHYDYATVGELSSYPEFYSIAWNNNPSLGANDRYALVGGDFKLVGIKPVDVGSQFLAGPLNYPLVNYTYIAWDESTWQEATLLADRGGASHVYQFQNTTKDIVVLGSDFGTPTAYLGVDYRPPQSPSWAMIVGSTGGYKLSPNAFHSDTTITISSDMPHIFSMDMKKMSDGSGGVSRLNTQVDVNEVYTFSAQLNYTVGGVDELMDLNNNVRINIIAFYDEGNTGVSSGPEGSWTTTYNRTRQFSLEWEEGDGGISPESASMIYPIGSPGTDEFLLDSWWRDPASYGADGNSYRFYFNVSFGPQTWAAAGSGPMGAAPNIWDDTSALNDANTWDIRLMVYDNDFSGSVNYSYDEFGIFQYTNITVSGSPSGNAPPGSDNQSLSNPSQITVTSNIPYYVNVSVPDLARVGGGGSISASYVKVRSTSTLATDTNSEIRIMQAFPGAGMNLSVWGNTSQFFSNWVVPAPRNGTTAHGPWGSDFNGYLTTDLLWYVTIPGATAEGVYQATITFRVGNYG